VCETARSSISTVEGSPWKMAEGERIKGLVIPGGLVHAHVHLDKCFLLEKTPIGDGSVRQSPIDGEVVLTLPAPPCVPLFPCTDPFRRL
jgi:hypothetical protein